MLLQDRDEAGEPVRVFLSMSVGVTDNGGNEIRRGVQMPGTPRLVGQGDGVANSVLHDPHLDKDLGADIHLIPVHVA
ncbi:hypothetical protein ABZS95_41170 [Streptomyces sp. NPDC005479]|uniref:hypothetical protein n=1 Tax=unclassified Streptomyces TaxID=2593676 RepID=UPI0033A59FBB